MPGGLRHVIARRSTERAGKEDACGEGKVGEIGRQSIQSDTPRQSLDTLSAFRRQNLLHDHFDDQFVEHFQGPDELKCRKGVQTCKTSFGIACR